MANYQADKINGWRRSNSIVIDNTLDKLPNITYNEEYVFVTPANTTTQSAGTISANFSDPSTEIELLNPEDDSVIGTSSYGALQVLLYSLYIKLTKERDGII